MVDLLTSEHFMKAKGSLAHHFDAEVLRVANTTPALPPSWPCTARYFIREDGHNVWQWQVFFSILHECVVKVVAVCCYCVWIMCVLDVWCWCNVCVVDEFGLSFQAERAKWVKRYFILFSDCLLVCREKVRVCMCVHTFHDTTYHTTLHTTPHYSPSLHPACLIFLSPHTHRRWERRTI